MMKKRRSSPPQCRSCRWLLEHRGPQGRTYWCVVKDKGVVESRLWRRACNSYQPPKVRVTPSP